MLLADQTLQLLINNYQFDTVLDIGCGPGKHSSRLKAAGKTVTSTDFTARFEGVVEGDYASLAFDQHDAIWCSHVLEHVLDAQTFLKKVISECKLGGPIAITVPPLKHEIVGGHVSLWNAGLLLYRLVLAGLDCRDARVGCYGYNVSVIVEKKLIDNMPPIRMGGGDIELLAEYFPIPVKQSFNGKDINHRWL